MKHFCWISFLLFFLAGCHGVQMQTPSTQAVTQPAKQTLAQKKAALSQKKKSATQIPEVLGGIVKSDEWVIYKDEKKEEFKGHVFYDNNTYTFKSNYALSDRKNNTFTASGNVYAKQKEPDTTYEAYADYARYNYKTGKGLLKSTTKNPVRLILTDNTQTVTAQAKQISFDTNTQVFVLTGKVDAKRVTPEGTQTMKADKATVKQQEDYLLLEGNAVLADDLRTLQADTVLYDGVNNQARAYGARPLATGSTEQGTFAIIADNVSSDAQGNVVTLDGRVQGWLVSPELNNNKINKKF